MQRSTPFAMYRIRLPMSESSEMEWLNVCREKGISSSTMQTKSRMRSICIVGVRGFLLPLQWGFYLEWKILWTLVNTFFDAFSTKGLIKGISGNQANERCLRDNHCNGSLGLVCIDNKCKCKEGHYWMRGICLSYTNHFGIIANNHF
ncbi:hypothetical protein ACOME3_001921 [Neoechinorhynchus agilis]